MVRDFSQKTVQELYETIRVNVDEEEQWKVFDFVEDFFMEELEIGDYINDINSYHLHMFDKHDVTTKKFDAIVEKAGKVDANYAAQIEGYCSLLGEYGKKFEAVCAMLQPEKLRLSPDKYREKLEGINTGYQNAKDTHEQEQSAYEAELYEIETVWYKKMLDKAEDYLIRSAECVVLGNFTDEVTVLGVGVQIVLGIFDLDLPCDIRDIIADVRNLAKADDIKLDMIAMLALDLIGVIPVIGALKYSDEIGTLFKNADKVSVAAGSTDGAGVLAKHADEAGAWLHGVKVFRYSDETAEAVTSGEKLLKESGTIYESFADMMSPEDAKRYLDFLENGSREGLTSAELADALLVSQKVGYEDVWDLRNVGDALETSYGKSSSNCTELVPYYPANNGAESGRKADFYVTPSGDVVPATGYRYMDSGRANDAIISGEQYTTYIGFKKYDSASQVKDAFQIADSWSDCKVRGEFDTLQVIDDLYVPTTKGNTTAIPEPITFSYPEYGKGGEHQLRVDKVIKFTNVDFIGD